METRKRERHGMSDTPTYHAWAMMKQRCYNGNAKNSVQYKERGIQVCDRWKDSFIAFLEDMGEAPEGLSIDRIDNDGDYCPENCRWATPEEQMNNTQRTRYITIDGNKRLITEVAKEKGIDHSLLFRRIYLGWTIEQALGLEEHYDPRAITINGETRTMAQWAKCLGMSRQAVSIRIQHGWSVADACTTPKECPRPAGTSARKQSRKLERADLLGAYLTELRQQRHWTQGEVGKRIGKSVSQISHYETGETIPRLKTLYAFAKVFGVTFDELIARMGNQTVLTHVNTGAMMEAGKEADMSMKERERGTWLQVRMTEEDKALLSELSEEYGLSISAFVRMMVTHFDEKRPTVSIRFAPKGDTLSAEMAQN